MALTGLLDRRDAGDVTESLGVRGSIAIPRRELAWRFSRSSGPGGQGVNTADSRVELSWNLAETTALPASLKERALKRLGRRLVDGVLTVTASEHRAQLQNRRAAETRLVALVADAIAAPPPRRKPTRPSRGAVQARLDAKRRRGEIKRHRRSPDE
jgi:ribosome-associated protein